MSKDFGSRLVKVFSTKGNLCVGIDPSRDALEGSGLSYDLNGLEKFSKLLLDAAAPMIGIVKPQVAYFEAFGSKGLGILEKVCLGARNQGLMVIADAKRGDIGSSMTGYADAWLAETSPFVVDALTLSPYLGAKSLDAVVQIASQNCKGVFLLALTSNTEGRGIQQAVFENQTVAQQIVNYCSDSKLGELGSVGVVIGATALRAEIDSFGKNLDGLPILAPGFGSQGGELKGIRDTFGNYSDQVIANVSRSIYRGGLEKLAEQVRLAKQELQEGLSI